MVIYRGNYVLQFLIEDCPICDCKLKSKQCKNGCFTIRDGYVIIFNQIILSDKNSQNTIAEKIKYWRTNDRYLIKILGE
jgi:hypothetical protein